MSQNITLSRTDWLDIAKIKGYLLENMNQQQIAKEIGKRRETINKKIGRWMQTEDFKIWANTLWLQHHTEVHLEDKKEALRALTKLLVSWQTRKMKLEEKIDITERIEVVKLDVTKTEDQILSEAAAILARKAKSQSIH